MEFLKHELINILGDDDNDDGGGGGQSDSNAHHHHMQQQQQQLPNYAVAAGSASASSSSSVRRSAARFMQTNRFFQQEGDELTRQRLLFVAIIHDHYEQLFSNAQYADRGPLWEEIRQFMVEQRAMSLLDKDWKYVAGCYWQNIRKDSLRRTVKQRYGVRKPALRPGLMELDRMVAEVLNMRGPGSYDTVLRNYARFYVNSAEDQSQEQEEEQQHASGSRCNETMANNPQAVETADDQLANSAHLLLSNSASPAMPMEQREFFGGQAALDQMVQSASNKIAKSNQQQQQQQLVVPISIGCTTSKVKSSTEMVPLSPPSLATQNTGPSSQLASQSDQLGKIVVKTHLQLMTAGHQQMAAEFEQQLKQMVNGYKAWMFDQLYGGDHPNVVGMGTAAFGGEQGHQQHRKDGGDGFKAKKRRLS